MQELPNIQKKIKYSNAYYSINWSPILPADKYSIHTSIPSMAGIFQLFYMDRYKKLVLIDMNIAWYGGLRSNLRFFIDPEREYDDLELRKILEEEKLFCRYTLSDSFRDLTDVLSLLALEEFENPEDFEPSGRYEHIFLKEYSPNKIVKI